VEVDAIQLAPFVKMKCLRKALPIRAFGSRTLPLLISHEPADLMNPRVETIPRLRWRRIYREAELYKTAVRVYTKPLFHWRKALNASADGKTLCHLASRGLASHRASRNGESESLLAEEELRSGIDR
jgi:hypothetical protein